MALRVHREGELMRDEEGRTFTDEKRGGQKRVSEMTGISGGRGGKHSGRVGRTGESTKLGVGRKRNIRTHIVLYINHPKKMLACFF